MKVTDVEHIATYDALENWGRWVIEHPKRSHCRSIEHRYRPNAKDDDPRRTPKREIDELGASRTERIISNPTFPQRERHMLRMHFAFWWINSSRTCRETGIRFSEYEMFLGRAVRMFENRLTRSEMDGKNASTI